jgi:hypothetical protein
MANWDQAVLDAVMQSLKGGSGVETPIKDVDSGMALIDKLNNLPQEDVFTWTDGRRYMFTDSGKPVPGGVTPVSREDFLSLIAGLME